MISEPRHELHIVSGKGGTGKTTVAAALALALAQGGRTTLLCEVEGRQGIAQLFDTPPLPYAETKIASADGGGEVYALAIEPKDALRDYLQMFYRMGAAMGVLERAGAVDFVTTIAPGLRDVMLTGKVYEAVGDRRRNRRRYDAVVLDAPPTGRIGRFLNVNAEVSGLARVGPVHSQSQSIMNLLRSDRTVIHLVTLPEEMPVSETADGVAELTGLGLPLGAVVVNRVRTSPLSDQELAGAAAGTLDTAAVTRGLKAAGLNSRTQTAGATAAALIAEAADLAERMELQAEQLRRVEEIGLPMVRLPELTDGADLAGVHELATLIGGAR